ncbi:Dynein assembly factor 1, axonemal, partial [Kappamyces sp. JEL0680]
MTLKYLKQLCKEQKGYQTPELNDIIYLHFKGFAKIENLEPYKGLKSLWLEGNGISKIENLGRHRVLTTEALTELKCLFMQQNCLSKLENLDLLVHLDTLNVANNLIKQIEGLERLEKLTTLTMHNNFLTSADDIRGVLACPSICVLDLGHNKLDDPQIVEVLEQMPKLAVLNLMGNPVISKITNYRKTIVSRCQSLNYLDDRPVFEKERLTTNAWAIGGLEGERAERERIHSEEKKRQQANFDAMRLLSEAGRKKRLEVYGEDQAPTFPQPLEKFRDDMLSKIEPSAQDSDLLQEAYDMQEGVAPPRRRNLIEEVDGSDADCTDEVPPLETPALIEEIEAPEETFTELRHEQHAAVDISMPPESPAKLFAFDRNLPALEPILEETETGSDSEAKYTTPPEQRRADLSLLDELVLNKHDSIEDMQEPLLERNDKQGFIAPAAKMQ